MRVPLMAAGRLPLSAQRFAHPDIIISQDPVAKCPKGSGRLSLLDGYALHRAMRIQIATRQMERHAATIRTRVHEPEIIEIPCHAKLGRGHVLWDYSASSLGSAS